MEPPSSALTEEEEWTSGPATHDAVLNVFPAIPYELSCDILSLSLASTLSEPLQYYHDLYVLCLVSKTWNAMIQGTPRFWSLITTAQSPSMRARCFEKSQGHALTVYLVSKLRMAEGGLTYGGLVQELLQHAEGRIRWLKADGMASLSRHDLTSLVTSSSRILEFLHLTRYRLPNQNQTQILRLRDIAGSRLPRLEVLRLDGIAFHADDLEMSPRLHELTLDRTTSPPTVLEILSHCPHVRTIHITDAEKAVSSPFTLHVITSATQHDLYITPVSWQEVLGILDAMGASQFRTVNLSTNLAVCLDPVEAASGLSTILHVLAPDLSQRASINFRITPLFVEIPLPECTIVLRIDVRDPIVRSRRYKRFFGQLHKENMIATQALYVKVERPNDRECEDERDNDVSNTLGRCSHCVRELVIGENVRIGPWGLQEKETYRKESDGTWGVCYALPNLQVLVLDRCSVQSGGFGAMDWRSWVEAIETRSGPSLFAGKTCEASPIQSLRLVGVGALEDFRSDLVLRLRAVVPRVTWE